MSRILLPAFLVGSLESPLTAADEVPPNRQYLEFIRKQAAELRKNDRAPATLEEWAKHEAELRKNLLAAWGGTACFPEKPCDLDAQQHGEPLKRDGYTVEKITIQTRPGVRMTANLYVPDAARKKKAPAILQVHGHWKGAKQDPVVQSRCIGAAKLGFVVLCVDAFGAGERGVGTALGEYHGDMTAATLLPLGLPLSGLQVYENMRAVDYLETRPEVDKEKIGITGASGGGNQTMYAGAWDKRFRCVVPVCSVGTYQSYLGQACCMCEVVPGALKFIEEWGVLALTAPRPLMVVNATKDAIQFSVGEAKKSLALTAPVYKLLGKPDNLHHAVFEGPHDYSKAMREAMYGFMTLHLKGEGNGDPIPEPAIKTENPEDLRCYPGDTRPKDFMTIPKFAAREGKRLRDAAKSYDPKVIDERAIAFWENSGFGFVNWDRPDPTWTKGASGFRTVTFTPEPGITLTATLEPGKNERLIVLLLNLDGSEAARKSKLYAALKKTTASVATVDLRGTGRLAVQRDQVGRASDHNTAEWALWLGRPLIAQWVQDVRSCIGSLTGPASPPQVLLIGDGPAGLVALATGMETNLPSKVAAVNTLATFVTDQPYSDQRLAILAPGILGEIGDIAHMASFRYVDRIVIAGGVVGNGKSLTLEELNGLFAPALQWDKRYPERRLVITTPDNLIKELGLTQPSEK